MQDRLAVLAGCVVAIRSVLDVLGFDSSDLEKQLAEMRVLALGRAGLSEEDVQHVINQRNQVYIRV